VFVSTTEALARMRAHLDADEVAVKQWISDGTALYWLNQGLSKFHRRLIRAGLVHPTHSEFDQSSFNAAGKMQIGYDPGNPAGAEPVVIYWVAEVNSDGTLRYLVPSQQSYGPVPLETQTGTRGSATTWWLERAEEDLGSGGYNVVLNPSPTTGTYRVAWQPRLPEMVLATVTPGPGQLAGFHSPVGLEEFPILHAIRMGFARAGEMPPSVTQMLAEAEAELELAAQQLMQAQGPAVRNMDPKMRGWPRRSSIASQNAITHAPTSWWWVGG